MKLEPYTEVSIKTAFETLKKAMQDDPSYAWTWQANIAMTIYDSEVDDDAHRHANTAAANVMQHLFQVDVRRCEEWKVTFEEDSEADDCSEENFKFKLGDRVLIVNSNADHLHDDEANSIIPDLGKIGTVVDMETNPDWTVPMYELEGEGCYLQCYAEDCLELIKE